jgi:hypothetical protein
VYLHFEILNGQLKLYVPNDRIQQKACYRSQLPTLFREILGISSPAADFPISLILSNDIEVLDDLMQESDISPVPWITKPLRDVASPQIEYRSTSGAAGSTPSSGEVSPRVPLFVTPSGTTNLFGQSSGTATLYNDSLSHPRWRIDSGIGTPAATNQYRDLLNHIIARVNGSNCEDEVGVWNLSEMGDALPRSGEAGQIFDRDATFGVRDSDQMAHDRKIGSAGELYVGVIKVRKQAVTD